MGIPNIRERGDVFSMWLFKRKTELKLHDIGKKVLKASELLAKHGSSLKPTEEFTLAMRSAVTAFQKKHNLDKTGIIDKKTWRELKKKL